jgi:nitroreductase
LSTLVLPRPAVELVEARRSFRSYDGNPLAREARSRLEAHLEGPLAGPFGTTVRLALLDEAQPDAQPRKLGTYGVIRRAPCFLVGAVREGPMALEDFGFVFERAILFATGLGLGTCWLGGTLRRDRFGEEIGVDAEEIVPAVSPVGYATERRSVVDSVFRWVAASKKRRPWSELFFAGDLTTPLSREAAGAFSQALEMVRLGPSASNRQPWRLVHTQRGFDLFLQRTPGYQSLAVDLQRLDMGIAMCHFELTARELGLEGEWRVSVHEAGALPPRTSYVASWIDG